MNDTHFNVVFDGGLMPGVDLPTAKANLATLFKSDPGHIEKLFCGRPVILKRNLSAAAAERYLDALHTAGVKARLEEQHAAQDNLAKPVAPPSATFQLAESQEPPYSPYAPPQASVEQPPGHYQYADLKVFSIDGRIGRLRYLAWTLALLAVVVAAMGILALTFDQSPLLSGALMLLAGICFVTISIQFSVQRLHDLGWSGWLWLLNLVPLVSSVFAIALLVLPGNTGPNHYGLPPPPNSIAVKLLAWMWALLFALAVASGLFGWLSLQFTHYTQSISL
ncbi:hypothetical protein D9M71_80580 [compost metagenome]